MYLVVLISFRVYSIARPGTRVIIDFHATWNFNCHLEGIQLSILFPWLQTQCKFLLVHATTYHWQRTQNQ